MIFAKLYYPIWSFRVHENAFRSPQCCPIISISYRSCTTWSRLRPTISGWHLNIFRWFTFSCWTLAPSFQCLNNNLLINQKKCEHFSPEVKFLGHLISSKGIATLPEKLDHINYLPLPRTVTNLRSFLGAVNFDHKFIPMASSILPPLAALAVGQT